MRNDIIKVKKRSGSQRSREMRGREREKEGANRGRSEGGEDIEGGGKRR